MVADSFRLRNRQLLVAANRYGQLKETKVKLVQTILFLLAYGHLIGQSDTSIVKTYYTDKKVFEEYQITTKDSARNGFYKSFSSYGKILSEGKYTNDEKTGEWVYYSNGASATEIVQKYNHTTQTELFYNYVYEKYLGAPRYPGGLNAMNEYITRGIYKNIKKEYFKKYSGKKLEVTFSIDRKSGEVTGVHIVPHSNQIEDPEVEGIIISIFQKLGKWTLSKTMTEKTNVGFSYTYPIRFKN